MRLVKGRLMALENISAQYQMRTYLYFKSYEGHRSKHRIARTDCGVNIKGNYIFSHFYNITLGMVKLSILAFYYRIFIIPLFRRIVLATITFIGLWVLTITVVLALQCRPIRKFWNPAVPGTCFDLVAFSYFTNITNLVTDVWIFLLPVPLIIRLHISTSRKIGLCGVFMVGLG